MRTKKNTSSFGFTACVWEEVHAKYWLFETITEFVEGNFLVENYTNSPKIKEIIFVVQVNPSPVDKVFLSDNYFAYRKGIIFLYGKIDYQTFLEASQQQALTLMCEAYLEAILAIPTLRGMKKVQFDTQKLYQDLKNLFIEKGLLPFST